MDELVTTDLILGWLKERVAHKDPIAPERYLDAATKLNILSSDESDKLIELEHTVSVMRSAMLRGDMSAAAAKVHVEGTPEFKELRKQQEKMKQITEAIRLAKLSARIKSDELRSGL